MREYFIGEVLRKRRLEKGLTQEELAYGIFNNASAISRIESGKQSPTYRKLLALLERLELPLDRYYALVDKNELIILELQAQIVSCQVCRTFQKGLEYLNKYELLTSADDMLAQQFLLSSKAVLGKYESGQVVCYSSEERLCMLFQAIGLTSPNLDLSNIERGRYSVDEIKILNQIALTYSNMGQRALSINIFSQLLKYIRTHFQELYQSAPLTILISYNYSRDLFYEHNFEKSFEMASLGLETSIKAGRSAYRGELLYVLASCFYKLKRLEKSKEAFYQAYYLFASSQDSTNLALTQSTVKDLFQIEIGY